MKIRNGFVSNSSSSSFMIISKEDIDSAPLMHADEDDSWLEVEADDKTCYNRGNNCRLDTLCDKVKYLTILYAYHYQRDPRYFFLMDDLRNKFQKLCKKYGYSLYLQTPSLRGVVRSNKYDMKTHTYKKCEPFVETYIESSTECTYVSEVVELIEAEDTTELESFLFNPHSFCILGGDEYYENAVLAYQARQEIDYPYRRISDDGGDFEADDPCPWRNGEPYGYSYHWGSKPPEPEEDDE